MNGFGRRSVLTLALLAAPPLLAQPAPAPSAAPAAEPTTEPEREPATESEASPRAALRSFLELAREGNYAEAARHLDARGALEARAPELAMRLKAVLDRHLWFDLASVSGEPQGARDDGLGPSLEELGRLPAPTPGGAPQPVYMVRASDGERHWVFSPGTLARVDAWYEALPDRHVREWLPEPLLRPGPGELLYWQWLGLLVLVPVAWALGRVFGFATRRLLRRIAARTSATWDDALLARLTGPLTLGWSLVLVRPLLAPLRLYAPAQARALALADAALLIAVIWAAWGAVGVLARALREGEALRTNPSLLSLLEIGERFAQVLVVAVGAVAALSTLGYPVASLLAGLGLGGLAFALAAQKTVENLFGSVSLAVDQPFRVGDFVKVEDFVGNVEAIGLRSTRIRTLDRTLVTIPNGRLADMRLESYTARDRMRLACTIGLEYGTSGAQMREVLAGLERVLREHPKIWPDAVVVRFKEFGASSLDIEVMAWFQVPDWGAFQVCRQEVLLGFMEVVEAAGTSFAFPTRTVHLKSEPAAKP
jgi:MscS family membrane protein